MAEEINRKWRHFSEEIRIDSGTVPVRKLWNDNRIIVHSYDSTGMLETLEANIPTIAFWTNGLDHLLTDAVPFYQKLVDVGIIHLTPESAADKINREWDNVEMWWKSNEVQYARKLFCSQYARSSDKPAHDLKKILLEVTKES
jgi:putative transferase (TIGR04331 family)